MVEVIVFAEGQSEEQFIKRLVAPALNQLQIYMKAQTLPTSKRGSGGAVSFDRLRFYARNALRQYPGATLTTFLDLYGLDSDFPGFEEAKRIPLVHDRVKALETALREAVIAEVGCRQDRFLPHIQPYEFEGLLFSDVSALSTTEPDWQVELPALQAIRAEFETPEHINNAYESKPSKRLEDLLLPEYKKTRHGPLAAQRVTLATMEAECPHFGAWMTKLRLLA